MTNIATVLKSEISRIARKEVRGETAAIKKTSSSYRTDIAAMKRRVQELEQLVRKLAKAVPKPAPRDPVEAPSGKLRFSAKGLAAQRKRLGLSAHDCGLLVGRPVSPSTTGKLKARAPRHATCQQSHF
jgi:hypothetical protein